MKVRAYFDYSPIRILRGVRGKEFIEPTDELAQKMGLTGNFITIEDSELPQDRTTRDIWKVIDGAVVIGDPTPEYLAKKFNTQKFLVDCQTAFSEIEKIQVMPYQRSFESMLDDNPPSRDFAGMMAAVQGLIAAGVLTESHYSKMLTCLAAQGISLEP